MNKYQLQALRNSAAMVEKIVSDSVIVVAQGKAQQVVLGCFNDKSVWDRTWIFLSKADDHSWLALSDDGEPVQNANVWQMGNYSVQLSAPTAEEFIEVLVRKIKAKYAKVLYLRMRVLYRNLQKEPLAALIDTDYYSDGFSRPAKETIELEEKHTLEEARPNTPGWKR